MVSGKGLDGAFLADFIAFIAGIALHSPAPKGTQRKQLSESFRKFQNLRLSETHKNVKTLQKAKGFFDF